MVMQRPSGARFRVSPFEVAQGWSRRVVAPVAPRAGRPATARHGVRTAADRPPGADAAARPRGADAADRRSTLHEAIHEWQVQMIDGSFLARHRLDRKITRAESELCRTAASTEIGPAAVGGR
jgi:hypothetical protein